MSAFGAFGAVSGPGNGVAGGGINVFVFDKIVDTEERQEHQEFLKSNKGILPFVQAQESVNNVSLELASLIKRKKNDDEEEASYLMRRPEFAAGFKPRTCLYEDVFEQLKVLHDGKKITDKQLYELTDNVFIILNFYTYVMSFPIDSAHDFRITDFFNYMRDTSLDQYLRNREITLETPLELGPGLEPITINQLIVSLAELCIAPSASQHALEERSDAIRSKLHEIVKLRAGVIIEAPLLTYVNYGKEGEVHAESAAGGGPAEDISGAEKIAEKLKEMVGIEFRVVVDTCKSVVSDTMTQLNQYGGDATFVDVHGSVLEIDGAGFSIPDALKSEEEVTSEFSALIGKYKFSIENSKIVLSVFNVNTNNFIAVKEIPKGASVQTLINLLNRKHNIKFPQGAMRSQTSKEYLEIEKRKLVIEEEDICALLSIKGAGDEFTRLISELFTRSRYLAKPMTPVPGLTVLRRELPTLLTTGDNLLAKNALDNGTICIHLKQRRKLVIGILPCLLANPMKGLITRFLELEKQTSGENISSLYGELDSAVSELKHSSYSGALTATLLGILISKERAKFNKTKDFVATLRGYLDTGNNGEFLKEIKTIGNYDLEPSNYLIDLLFGGDAGEIVFERVKDEDSNNWKVKLMPQKRVEKKVKVSLYSEFFEVTKKVYVVGFQQGARNRFLLDSGIDGDTRNTRQLSWVNPEPEELTKYNEWKEKVKPEKQTKMTDKEMDVLDMTALACGICLAQNGSVQYNEDIDEDVLRKAIESTTLPLFLREVSILPVNMLIKDNGRPTVQFRPKFYRYVFFSLYSLVKQNLPQGESNEHEATIATIAIETAKVYIDFIYMTWINNDKSFDFYALIPQVIGLLTQSVTQQQYYPLNQNDLNNIIVALEKVFKPFNTYKTSGRKGQFDERKSSSEQIDYMKTHYLLTERGLFELTGIGEIPDESYFDNKVGPTSKTVEFLGDDDGDPDYVPGRKLVPGPKLGGKRTRKYVEKTNKKTKRSNRSKSKKSKTKKSKTRKYYKKRLS